MPSLNLSRDDVVIGVDTHKDRHVAVALDGIGGKLAAFSATADNAGYVELLARARGLGRVVMIGIEGSGSYGVGLTRFLRRQGVPVREVARPPRQGERRRLGKSDTVDAEHAARQVLSGEATGIPKVSDGQMESLRLIKIVRDSAVKARSQAMITLKAILVTAPDAVRADLERLSDFKMVTACACLCDGLAPGTMKDEGSYVLSTLARRWLDLHEEIKRHTRMLRELVESVAPRLTDAFGVGFDSAAELLLAAGGAGDRIRSEAAFAKLCGVCPIPASSGRTTGRHRLNRGGNRQANAALYRIVIVRMRWHAPTIDYVCRRTAQGLTKKDIIRCLKRYVAREAFHLLPETSDLGGTSRIAA